MKKHNKSNADFYGAINMFSVPVLSQKNPVFVKSRTMKSLTVISCICVLLSCCRNTPTDKDSQPILTELSDSLPVTPLHPDLLKAWNRYRERGMGGINDTSICYFMGFHSFKKDSFVSLFFKDCGDNGKYVGYKGMTNIDGYYVAVLDFENIGKDFYNNKLLIQKNIDEFKCGKSDCISGRIIAGDSITLIGCNLSFKIINNRIKFRRDHLNQDIP